MAYIYQITNDINGKIYIGKTEFSIEKRFKEHCQDAFRDRNKKRPLYAAMRKYGIEHFHIELIEETDNPEEREVFWIENKRSFKNGYNATKGGDGRPYLDYDLIISTYNEVQNISQVSQILNYDEKSISNVLHSYNILPVSQQLVNQMCYGKSIKQYTKSGELIGAYPSIKAAARAINKTHSHISDCINGKRKSAYGFIWCYDR